MNDKDLANIDKLIDEKKVNEAQIELSKLGSKFHKDATYLYLRAKVLYLNKIYYLAIDTLLIALEFEENEKIYNLLSTIYDALGNKDLSKNFLNKNLRQNTANSLKNELSGIYRKKEES
tara:strand:+ start:5208 stop:5564 length:357 start_codon:yes stop_codon:yes gene_type:complete